MSTPRFAHPHDAALGAMRDLLAANLGLKRNLVGGWELFGIGSGPTIAVYTHEGDFMPKPGGMTAASNDALAVVLTIRGGPLAETEAWVYRDAIRHMLATFTHSAVAGVTITGWAFDIQGQGTFTNILTLRGKVAWKSFAPTFPAQPNGNTYDPADRYALVREMLLELKQIGVKEDFE